MGSAKRIKIFVLCIVLEILLILFLLTAIGVSRPAYVERFWFKKIDNMYVVSNSLDFAEQLYEELGRSPDYVRVYKLERPGPLELFVEFYETRTLDFWPIFTEHYDKYDSNDEAQIQQAIYEFSKNDPILSQYNPGGPPVTKFSGKRTIYTILKITVFLLIPLALTALVEMAYRKQRKSLQDQRIRSGKCAHCEYEIVGLMSPTCPECGKEHGSKIEEPV